MAIYNLSFVAFYESEVNFDSKDSFSEFKNVFYSSISPQYIVFQIKFQKS